MSDVLERFLRYVQVDSQSDPNNELKTPSTPRQHEMARVLGEELAAIGLEDVAVDEHAYVTATLPASAGAADAPALMLCAHIDTAPDAPGAGALAASAMQEAFGREMTTLGQGGSIPLCNVFADTYPEAEIILMGVEEPLALYLAVELLSLVRTLHRIGIVHGGMLSAFTDGLLAGAVGRGAGAQPGQPEHRPPVGVRPSRPYRMGGEMAGQRDQRGHRGADVDLHQGQRSEPLQTAGGMDQPGGDGEQHQAGEGQRQRLDRSTAPRPAQAAPGDHHLPRHQQQESQPGGTVQREPGELPVPVRPELEPPQFGQVGSPSSRSPSSNTAVAPQFGQVTSY